MGADASAATGPLEEIKRAFHGDNAQEVRRLLGAHPELSSLINEPVGPFHSPAIVNVKSREMLDVLLDHGADINAKSKWWAGGFGLLDSADPNLAEYAITRGAKMTIHAACRLGKVEAVRSLLSADPELVHARGGDGQMPLHFAGTVEIAGCLLDHGADIDARDLDHESTAAQWMIDERQEIVRYLISRGCQTDILMAAAVGDISLVRALLDADPSCIRHAVSDEYYRLIGPEIGGTIYQWTLGWYVRAHQVARKYGREDVLALLVERSPAAVLLIDACWLEDEKRVKQIVKENPNVLSELTEEDRRHLAHAARNNKTEAVRLMLECGLPVDSTSQHQGMALHWAAFQGNLEMLRMILAHNPPLEVKDADHGGTPLGWAIYGSENGWDCKSGDYPGTVEALLAAGAQPPEHLGGSAAVRAVLAKHNVS